MGNLDERRRKIESTPDRTNEVQIHRAPCGQLFGLFHRCLTTRNIAALFAEMSPAA